MKRSLVIIWTSVLLVGVGMFAAAPVGAAVIYNTSAIGNIGVHNGFDSPTLSAHDVIFGTAPGTVTHSVASASGNTLNSFTSSGNGNGAAPMELNTKSRYTDEIVIDWGSGPTVTLALNTNLSGTLNLSGWAFAELELFSYLGGTGSGMFTGGGPNLSSRYAPLYLSGPKCDGFGGFCAAFAGNPTTFDTSAQLGSITVPTNTALPFVFELRAHTSVGTSGGFFGNGTASVSASVPAFGDIFTVMTDGFDGNIYSTSGLIDDNQWVTSSVPEPTTFGLAAFGLLPLGFVGWRRRRRT